MMKVKIWDTIHLEGDMTGFVLSTNPFQYLIWELRYNQNNMGHFLESVGRASLHGKSSLLFCSP